MIRSIEDLRHYMEMDSAQFKGKKPGLRDMLLCNERFFIYHLKRQMGYTEYYMNQPKRTAWGGKIGVSLLPFQALAVENEIFHYA